MHWIGGWVGPRASLVDMEKRKIRPYQDSNSDPLVIQPIVSRYTDYAILAPRDNPQLLSCGQVVHVKYVESITDIINGHFDLVNELKE
jgi:hypothetical protein